MSGKGIFDKDDDSEKGPGGWSNHVDQPYNPFQSDFYRRFGGLYDGSPKANQTLQGYGASAEEGDLPNAGFPTGDEEMGERASSGAPEEARSDDEGPKSPKRRQLNHSDDELEDGRGMAEEDGDQNMNGQMEEDEEQSPRSDHLQNHNKHDDPRSGGALGGMNPLSMNQGLPLDKQWQPGLGLMPSGGGPPSGHLEQHMNMMSVMRAYSNDNIPAFNGLGGGAGGASTGGMKRPDPSGKCVFNLSRHHNSYKTDTHRQIHTQHLSLPQIQFSNRTKTNTYTFFTMPPTKAAQTLTKGS